MRRPSTTDGYLTVLFSLTMALFLSLILTLFHGVRIGLAKMQAECVTEIGIESVLAEYHRGLFDRYDLLLTDMSYGTAAADICNTEEHLRHYVRTNLERTTAAVIGGGARFSALGLSGVSIPEYVRASDGNGAVLRSQILAYMKAEPVEEAFSEAAENLELLRLQGYDTYDMEAEMDQNDARLKQLTKGEDASDERLGAPVAEIGNMRRFGILTLAHPSPSSISAATVVPAGYISHRGAVRGNGTRKAESLTAADLLLIDQYLFEKCGSHAAVREGSRLRYQLEYIIAGKGSDYSNLETVAAKILFWREASNFLYILTDDEKTGLAGGLAAIAAALLLLPEIEEPLKYAILFSWSFAESVSDIRILLDGGRVPLVKTGDTWKTSFTGMTGFGRGAGGTSGLDYEGYLRMLVLMTDINTKTMRLMDIMEMDIREMPGNLHFTMDGCIDHLTAEVSFESPLGFSGTFRRSRGYTEEGNGTEAKTDN